METLEEKTNDGIVRRTIRKVRGLYSDTFKAYAVNTFTPMTIFQPLLIANEYFIGGSEPLEILKTRAFNIAMSAITNDVLFNFRDRLNKEKSWKRVVKDLALASIVAPFIYAGLMYAGGNEPEEILRSLPLGTAIIGPLSSIYLFYHDSVRKKFGTLPEN